MPNKPKILSNELDQVGKKGERYRQELLKEQLSDHIIDAFHKTEEWHYSMEENDFFIDEGTDKSVLERFFKNNKNLPMEQIAKMLKEKSVISCELFREKKEKNGWTETVWSEIPREKDLLWTVLTQKDLPIEGYNISYVTFTKLRTKWWPEVKISLQQVGFNGEWWMMPEYTVSHNELTGKKVDTIKDISIGPILEK